MSLASNLRRRFTQQGWHKPRIVHHPGFEQLEQLILLNADNVLRGGEVSDFSVMYEPAEDGEYRRVLNAIPLYQLGEPKEFSGEAGEHVEVTHQSEFEIAEGTIMASFRADDVFGHHAIFSKDASGKRDGGHITAFVSNGRVKVRLQTPDAEKYLWSPEGSILNGEEHHMAVTFGADGYWLYLDGRMVDWKTDFTQGLQNNAENLAIGTNTWNRSESNPNHTSNHFVGGISSFSFFDKQFDRRDIAMFADFEYQPPQVEGRTYGTLDDETLSGSDVDGGYGDDTINGTAGNDRLDGGHGEDRLFGGDGDDLLISRADGREPVIAQDYGPADDPGGEVYERTRTIYPYQPIESDDTLEGGPGADTFRFETLINAKEHIILKHVHDNGMIHWHGVAGENDFVHDHWAERLGNEIILDFNRAEGDKIEIVGHTIDAYRLEHIDSDSDGILDASVIYLQSNQGNAGAHNKDRLGTITVFGDLVLESDYMVDAKPAYGIVDFVFAIDEAITPLVSTPVSEEGLPTFPDPQDGELPEGAVFGMLEPVPFTGERGDHLEVEHQASLELDQGTVTLKFTADDIFGSHALFSKDGYGKQDGGHLTAFVYDGRVKVRLQSVDDEVWLRTAEGSIEPGVEYELAITFGDDGFWVYLDGRMEDWAPEFTQGISANDDQLAIGANIWHRNEENPTAANSYFDGVIRDFVVYDSQFTRHEVADLAGFVYEPPIVEGRTYGTDESETLSGNDVHAGYGDDTVNGTSGNDRLDGGHGEDRLVGGEGDDLLISRADGREPVIAQDYTSEEDDPYGEVNAETRTLYPDQPIEADDVLVGGPGADTFRFEVLINAKENIILKHVMDNRMIHWHGVAGENDLVHDHWVDRLGDEVIEDFNRAEGDRIEVVGHTVDVYKHEHIDTDGDGILDASVLYVQSNQGNAGAHNKDQLGTITVFGDLITRSDYTVDANPAYGIVETIDELDEALTPRAGTPVRNDGTPPPFPEPQDGTLPGEAIFGVINRTYFAGEQQGDHLEVAHQENLELAEGTVAMSFVTEDANAKQALFSKDASGNKDGGHLTMFINDGHLHVRLQSVDESRTLETTAGSIVSGVEYHVAVTFGQRGFALYLDGQPVDIKASFTQGINSNTENLVIGANGWSRTEDRPFKAYDNFVGEIENFMIFGRQFLASEVEQLAAS